MPVDPVSCPYCNAQVPVPAGTTAGQRIPCPRCGELFAYRGPDAGPPAAPVATAEAPSLAKDAPPLAGTGWSNRAIAGMILMVMATMAVLAMTFAQLTVEVRRAHDTERPERRFPMSVNLISIPIPAHLLRLAYVLALIVYLIHSLRQSTRRAVGRTLSIALLLLLLGGIGVADLAAITLKTAALLGWSHTPPSSAAPPVATHATIPAVAPIELAGLGYLPKRTNVAAALHVAEALQSPVGREFLAHYRLGPTEISLNQIEQWSGLKPDDIDHVVLGLSVGDEIPPPFVLVVQTRRPYAEKQVLARLKAGRQTEQNRKVLYRFKIEKPSLDPVLWCAAPNTLVVGLTPKDLDAVPLTPATGKERLAPDVQTLLTERLGPGTQAWLAGHIEQWDKISLLLSFFVPEQERTLLTKTRALVSSLRLDPDVTLTQTVRCADETAAVEVEKYFAKQKPEELSLLKMLGPGPEVRPITRELIRTYKLERHGKEVTQTAIAGAEVVRQAMEKSP